jgi:HAD superfamily hydrolase (TIGR01450 family)
MTWASIRTVLCDLDGVVWLAHRPIPGSVEALAALRAAGLRVVFVTNNSAPTISDNEAALAAVGIPAAGDVVSSSMAAAHLIAPGERALVVGGPGVAEAVERRGAVAVMNDGVTPPGDIDVVLVGLDRHIDYGRLTSAASAVRSGARLIATNTDSTYPTPDGLLPGGGAIVAAVATASGVDPIVAGKPHEPMAALIMEMVSGPHAEFDPSSVLMVGDRADTDGLFAERLGCRFGLVRSGVTGPGQSLAPGTSPAVDAVDLAALVRLLLADAPAQ